MKSRKILSMAFLFGILCFFMSFKQKSTLNVVDLKYLNNDSFKYWQWIVGKDTFNVYIDNTSIFKVFKVKDKVRTEIDYDDCPKIEYWKYHPIDSIQLNDCSYRIEKLNADSFVAINQIRQYTFTKSIIQGNRIKRSDYVQVWYDEKQVDTNYINPKCR